MRSVLASCGFALLLAGCTTTFGLALDLAPSSTSNAIKRMSQVPAECVNTDADVQAACAYLLGEAQSRLKSSAVRRAGRQSSFPVVRSWRPQTCACGGPR